MANKSDSCVERICAAIGAGGAFGGLIGAGISAFKRPSVEIVMDMSEAAKAKIPRATRLMGANSVLFGAVGASYAGGKCVAEGLTGLKDHPINSGIGGSCAGVALGIYKNSQTVLLGSMLGFFVVCVVGDINGPHFVSDPARMKKKWNDLRRAE